VQEHNAQAEELGHVTRQTARAFMDAEAARGVTAKTWNDTMKLLRATCKYLLPAGSINPFSGVPLELVQKVTGHKTVDVVLKHYFQPGREEFRRAIQSAMPNGSSRDRVRRKPPTSSVRARASS
jgi:hypothetical protein